MREVYFQVREGKDYLGEELPVEIVERKGKGHPDSLCDGAAEELSVVLSEIYRQHTGKILHHNVDKAVLVGGSSRCWFGGGEVLEPMDLFLVGRATNGVANGKNLIDNDYCQRRILEWIKAQVPHITDKEIRVRLLLRSGSQDLVNIFKDDHRPPMANDTSFAVGYAPMTELEKIVLEVERYLNGPQGKQRFPALGEDIKVMGVKKGELISLTVAGAFIASEVKDREEYEDTKVRIRHFLLEEVVPHYSSKRVEITINNADTLETAYLTVTGTSAEAGDDGQVGRGNRANGLITPYRPMSLEAVAGKNPVSHVGKIYAIMSQLIAKEIIRELPEVKQAYVYMVSRINEPITRPQALNVEVLGVEPRMVEGEIKKIAEGILESWKEIRDGFVRRRWSVY